MSRKTINEIISYVDEVFPNQYSTSKKIQWLNEIDEDIYNNIISKRKEPIETEFKPYNEDDIERRLLVETPHTEIYRYWIEAKINYANRETAAFNNSMAMYNSKLDDYTAFYNDKHRYNAANVWIV